MGIQLSSVVITAANTHDVKAAIDILDRIKIKRPIKKKKPNLCLDRAYDSHEIERKVVKSRYTYRISINGVRKKGKYHNEKSRRRWVVVERTNSLHNSQEIVNQVREEIRRELPVVGTTSLLHDYL